MPAKQVTGPGRAKKVKTWLMPRGSGRAGTRPDASSALISDANRSTSCPATFLARPVERANPETVARENELTPALVP